MFSSINMTVMCMFKRNYTKLYKRSNSWIFQTQTQDDTWWYSNWALSSNWVLQYLVYSGFETNLSTYTNRDVDQAQIVVSLMSHLSLVVSTNTAQALSWVRLRHNSKTGFILCLKNWTTAAWVIWATPATTVIMQQTKNKMYWYRAFLFPPVSFSSVQLCATVTLQRLTEYSAVGVQVSTN